MSHTSTPAQASASAVKRVPISGLPLPPPPHSLIHALTPDPYTPTPAEWHNIRAEKPSLQRRARLLTPSAHFSYVAPCPLPFPFRVEYPEEAEEPQEGEDAEAQGKAQVAAVERWLVEREALREVPGAAKEGQGRLRKYVAEKRDEERVLIGLAETGLRDCVPHLDVGDAFELLKAPSLTVPAGQGAGGSAGERASAEAVAARQELVDVLSGNAILVNGEGEVGEQWAPWSLRYSGHQFGNWAGQLGDGRAISLLATPHPDDPRTTYELQLKGAGRTPFSRMADGLAVLRSSIREFLCSEAMHALGISTTRSLSLIHLPKLPVERERIESACVLTRVAPSFIRIGSFEALNPPAQMYFLGGGQQAADLDALRVLGEWVARHVLALPDVKWRGDEGAEGPGDAWGTKLVLEVARRNAKMVAGWQAYGFMHGVINTDNVSILGLTIDYGPYAFMDVFDPWHICNHSDQEGRYAYKYQPAMIIYALRALLNALAPLIGAEDELGGKAVSPGWADDASKDQAKEWSKRGTELVKDEMERVMEEACAVEYGRLMHRRLGLRRIDKDDESKFARPLLSLMEDHSLDFHRTFRRLCFFTPSVVASEESLKAFIDSLLELSSEPERLDRIRGHSDWSEWLRKYAARIESERDHWDGEGDVDAAREREAKSANPRFVLRQWLLEEVIKKVETDTESGKRVLGKVLHMACNPYEPWGAEGVEDESGLDAETKEERRYCGMGERKLLGFQCSCSS
ncbi:hypothetical protein DICSQDRAFT_52883 [Dichomitus squalens LYAD-421 SS1]|uniref:uncharacterized protein n=1 Tax=Dichomitus squalens (strain LYAD-421) TaxID=732165 RepID=UPI0004413978|nr:uncharacterized protein DICSQDRAFT_52883 [Dichomitus squalens LYAD-421 SS1]EJF64664.1 hypothetical protein DICSQDRAFT_52883 [Dichomitus squalens LYAD-421 SS1]